MKTVEHTQDLINDQTARVEARVRVREEANEILELVKSTADGLEESTRQHFLEYLYYQLAEQNGLVQHASEQENRDGDGVLAVRSTLYEVIPSGDYMGPDHDRYEALLEIDNDEDVDVTSWEANFIESLLYAWAGGRRTFSDKQRAVIDSMIEKYG